MIANLAPIGNSSKGEYWLILHINVLNYVARIEILCNYIVLIIAYYDM